MRLVAVLAVAACSSPAAPPPTSPKPTMPDPTKPDVVAPAPVEDPNLWLEDVEAERSLAWVKERNAESQKELEATPGFAAGRDRIRAILDSKDKIPYVWKLGASYYNFWKDVANPKGLLRRTSLAEYKKASPTWETVLDVDALAVKDGKSWVYQSFDCLPPAWDRCLVGLSPGGGDALVIRELDPIKKDFIAGGFEVPVAKTQIGWKDRDTVYVGTDTGPGSLTSSGYPRTVREWKRGTKLADAPVVFEGKETDVSVSGGRTWQDGKPVDVFSRAVSFFASESYLVVDGKQVKLAKPDDADVMIWHDQLLFQLRSDWTEGKTWKKGSLIAIKRADFLAGKREFTQLFEPSANRSLNQVVQLKSSVVTNELVDLKPELTAWKHSPTGWTKSALPVSGERVSSITIEAVDPFSASDDYWLTYADYLAPTSLSLGTLGKPATKLKQGPSMFDAKGLVATQHFATSKDGTKVPYFQISRDNLALDGNNPTVLYGYGGFEVSELPEYSPIAGSQWIERGGVYVVANIRGGGEYGPAWHQAAMKQNRQRAYDDFIAVAEDLIARKVTRSPKLGIVGGSNGGLLMGVMLTQRPELFGAIVCAVPLLDMKRYHKLLAGASWMEEYGDPDKPEDWAFISKYSPYQNVRAGTKYPRTLFTTSTRDDRVHPGHARKMVARMREQGHDVLYYENIEGGHAGAADNQQAAFMQAFRYAFFAKQLGLK